jgi:drug/metabolite transporter (DMT)-like permease
VFLCKSFLSLVQRSSVDKIRPALLNALVGLVTTLINVYTTQGGHWFITAVVTAAVTAFITLVTVTLSVLYVLWTKPAWKEHCAMNR